MDLDPGTRPILERRPPGGMGEGGNFDFSSSSSNPPLIHAAGPSALHFSIFSRVGRVGRRPPFLCIKPNVRFSRIRLSEVILSLGILILPCGGHREANQTVAVIKLFV